ncbi:MAG: hypothetical protein WD690_12045 [Vicinamibacterales bacterium]
MTQHDWVRIATGAVIGIALGAVLGAGVLGMNFGGDTETDVTVSVFDGKCTLGKADRVVVKRDKQLIWEIENYCIDGPKTVMVGNFQKQGPSTGTNCSNPGPDYPFTDASEDARTETVKAGQQKGNLSIDPSDGKIKLKAKDGDAVLGKYYFDICLDGQKVDPELMMER